MDTERTWQVLLLGGASGIGKTSVSYPLAHHVAVGLTEVDDLRIMLERMTTPAQYPELHLWPLYPDAVLAMDDAEMLAHTRGLAGVMAQALEPVIAYRLTSNTPVVIAVGATRRRWTNKGDFLLPALAVRPTYDGVPAGGRVYGVFLHKDDEQQILRNHRAREGEEQSRRARASWYHCAWPRRGAAWPAGRTRPAVGHGAGARLAALDGA